jgi:CheY-like chemotaxis protein
LNALWKTYVVTRNGSAKTTFLLVEDDPKDVYLVKNAFDRVGHCRLKAVTDGQEAIDYLTGIGKFADRRKFPLPQVLLLDMKMPRVNGLEFLRWLRHDSPNSLHLLPVVVMSSSNEPKDVEAAYELGVNSYLLKPIAWQEFQERMKALNIFWADHVEKPVIS